ncbi:hypothetical protein JCM9492_08510 [Aquifex pyrophilus]
MFLSRLTSYERESLLKSFILFFTAIEFLLCVITALMVSVNLKELKHNIYLRLINYSYTFKGKEFRIEIVKNEGKSFYRLYEDEKGLYILVPIPDVKEDVLKVIYPSEEFNEKKREVFKNHLVYLSLFTLINLILSLIFSLYSIAPLRKAVEVMTEISRDVAHDMKTPLTSLLINVKILKRKCGEESLRRMEEAVNQLIALSDNLSSPQLVPLNTDQSVNINEIVESVVKDFRELYPDIKAELNLKKVSLKGDSSAVRRIVDNVVSNAFKHNTGKWVRITLDEKKLLVENPSKPLKDVGKIFDKFYKETDRGTGIGLYVVKKLAELHGWKMRAEYKNGIFRIRINFR